MSGTLALVGGREFTPGCSFDADLVAETGGEAVLIVATAAAYENPARLVQRSREWFANLDTDVVELAVYRRAEALDVDLAARVSEHRFIYLCSGSGPHVRSVLIGTPVLDAIVAAWQSGAAIAASGAAAAALCLDMVDARGGAFTVGLGVLDGFTVVPHYDTWSADQNTRSLRMAPKGLPVIGLDERTAAIRSGDGRWSFQGAGRVEVFIAGQPVNGAVLP